LKFEPLEDRRLLATGVISGQNFNDLDGDGVRDPDEPGRGGWTIELVDPANGEVLETQLARSIDLDDSGSFDPLTEHGRYVFDHLPPGEYEVRQVAQPAWIQTFPTLASNSGKLQLVQVRDAVLGGVGGLDGAQFATVSPDGRHVYATSSQDDALVVLQRDAATGKLSEVQLLRGGPEGVDGLQYAPSLTISPDGRHAYVASYGDDALTVFARNSNTGKLAFVEAIRNDDQGVAGMNRVRCVAVSPDGRHVYSVSREDVVAAFARNPETGKLLPVDLIHDGTNGADLLGGLEFVTLSPDGHHVYVAASYDNAVTVFRRDPETGSLAFVQALREGEGGVEGLEYVNSVTVSPDGNHVYTTGHAHGAQADDAVAVFRRDADSGELTPVEVIRDGPGDENWLKGAHTAVVSPDGKNVYIASRVGGNDPLTVFDRDAVTGRLTLVEVIRNYESGMHAISNLSSVTISPDGNHVYTAANGSDSVAVFARAATLPGPHRLTLAADQTIEDVDFGTFTAPGPRVVSASIGPDDTVLPGEVTFEATFDRPLRDEMLRANSATCLGALTGQYKPSFLDYDADARKLTVRYADLPEDTYTHVLDDGSFIGLTGNALDGELPGGGTLPSGNGAPGGDYRFGFSTDSDAQTAATFPSPLQRSLPAGSLIYRQSTRAVIAPKGDVDHYAIELDAGQTITVVPRGDEFPASVSLRDPDGNLIGLANASVWQTVPTSRAGTYTVEIHSSAPEGIGGYSLDLIVNAAVEREQPTQRRNNEIHSAEVIDNSFIPVGTGLVGADSSERGAVVGFIDDADEDWYRFTLDDGQSAALVLADTSSFHALSLELYDDAGQLLAIGAPASTTQWEINGFVDATADGGQNTYFARIGSEHATNYTLLVTRDAEFDARPLRDPAPEVLDVTRTGTVLGAIGTGIEPAITFAALGAMGIGGADPVDVSEMVHLWDPGFIITTGDNNCVNPATAATSWSRYVGGLYGDFILGRTDRRNPELTATTQRFFPTVGDRERGYERRITGYLDYLHDDPLGGRLPAGVHTIDTSYYDFRQGPIHFFALDSGSAVADEASRTEQATWLRRELAESTAAWKIVYLHHAPYSSGINGSNASMQWSFAQWGADAVIAGHSEHYERLVLYGLPYFVSAAGGHPLSEMAEPVPGSAVRYNDFPGSMRVTVDGSRATFDFLSINDGEFGNAGGSLIDRYTVDRSPQQPDAAGDTAEYRFAAAAGDTLRIESRTPALGPPPLGNPLDPKLELYDPAGTLVAVDEDGAPDGRNALITHAASATGMYRVRVAAQHDTSGEYLLTVDGHSGAGTKFGVVATDPFDGAIVAATPATIAVDFAGLLSADSLEADDLTVDGVAALGVTLLDVDTAVFDLPALDAGEHHVAIAGGAILSLPGEPIEPYSGSFTIDLTPPRIVASSISEGDVLPAGPLVYTAAFSKAIDAADLDPSDFTLFGQFTGMHDVESFDYDALADTLALEFPPLPEDRYTLRLLSHGGALHDAAGRLLDGEPLAFPMPPNVSGDGSAGGNFYVHFTTDSDVAAPTAFPLPLEPALPAGSLIYESTVTGALVPATDEDRFAVDLQANQTITVAASADSTLQMTLTLIDPSGNTLAMATAEDSGDDVVLQTAPAAVAGTYRLIVGSRSEPPGTYTIRMVLGAAVESEEYGGPDNSALALAQDLDAAFAPLAGGQGERAAVLGYGRTKAADWYRLSLDPTQPASLMLLDGGNGPTTLALLDAEANLLVTGTTAANADRAIGGFVAPATGTYYVFVSALDTSYSLVVTRGAEFDTEANDGPDDALLSLDATGVALGHVSGEVELLENGSFETGDFSGWTATTLGDSQLTPWTVGPGGGGFFFNSSPADGTYSAFNGFDGVVGVRYQLYQEATIPRFVSPVLTTNHRIVYSGNGFGTQPRTLSISVRDTNGELLQTLYSETIPHALAPPTDLGWNRQTFDLSGYEGRTVRIQFTQTIPETYTGPALFEVDGVSLAHNFAGADAYEITLAAGEAVTVTTQTPLDDPAFEPLNTLDPELSILDADGQPLAADANSAADGKNAKLRFVAPAAGTYIVRVDSQSGAGAYVVQVRRGTDVAARHVFYNHSAFDGQDPLANSADDAAIATNKQVLLPGQTATFANHTSHASGISGVMIDVAGLPDDVSPGAGDFLFRVGNSHDPSTWSSGPAPAEVALRRGAGVGGSDRVTLTWPDFAIRNQWLEVTVLAEGLSLPANDVFYIGNAVAESGNSTTDAMVTTTDLLLARNNTRNFLNPAGIDFAYDYNRDRRVNATDVLLARNNVTNFLSALKLLDLSDIDGRVASTAEDGESHGPSAEAADRLLTTYWP